MKSLIKTFKRLPSTVSLISCVCLTGCYSNPAEEIIQSSENGKLSVVTRSSTNNELQYPLVIYAFDESGNCKSEKVVKDSSEPVKMNLAEGKYRLVAVAGGNGYKFPTSISLNSEIIAQNGNYSDTELAIGRADAIVSGSSTATIQMAPQVACVELELEGLAEDVSTVSINISKQFKSVTFDGEYGTGENSVIECIREGNVWKSRKVYVFPGVSENTVFSITTIDDYGSHNYGYTYSSKLKAGQPYKLNGTFSSGVVVNGNIEYSGWKNEVVLDFSFGPGINETGGNSSSQSGENNQTTSDMKVTSIPKAGSILDGHVVALVSNETETSADVLLLSLTENIKVPSANAEQNANESISIASQYSENGLTGWSIPTKEEATILKTTYGGANLSIINNVLETAGGTLISAVEDNGGNARYLCENSKYTFTFNGTSSSITQAGASVKYRLRLVKKLHLTSL